MTTSANERLLREHRLAERLKAGGVYPNGATQLMPHRPFGGLGIRTASAKGRARRDRRIPASVSK